MLLFGAVFILTAGLAMLVWRSNRGVAVVACGLGVLSALCMAMERAASEAHASIRLDLLVTIPAVSVAAVVIGIFALRRPPVAARLIAGGLVGLGGISFTWFSWGMVRSNSEGLRLTAIFNQARRLYFEETVRCQGNLVKRFGPLNRHDNPCYGHGVVGSRSAGGYPFTRAIVNDEGQMYLLFASDAGIEDNWSLSDGPTVRLEQGPGGVLTGESNASGQRVRVELRAIAGGACQARVEHGSKTTVLTLAKTELAPCATPVVPPVRLVGAWGSATPVANSPQFRRLIQIWLWDTDGTARGLFLGDLAPSGMRRDFTFAKQMRGSRRGENEWELRAAEEGGETAQSLIVALVNGRARVTGSTRLLGSSEVVLDPQEVVSHPKIALVPLCDGDRFALYFDNVLFNLSVPWTPR